MLITSLEKEQEEILERGIEQGIEQEKIKIAKSMLLKGLNISLISEFTELSEDKILEIKSELVQ